MRSTHQQCTKLPINSLSTKTLYYHFKFSLQLRNLDMYICLYLISSEIDSHLPIDTYLCEFPIHVIYYLFPVHMFILLLICRNFFYMAQHEGAVTPRCIVQKNLQVPHTNRQVACHPVNNSKGKRRSIPQQKTRCDSLVPTLQGPWDPSQKRRGSLRFLHPSPAGSIFSITSRYQAPAMCHE